MQGDAFARPASGSASVHIARTSASMSDACASAPRVVLDPDSHANPPVCRMLHRDELSCPTPLPEPTLRACVENSESSHASRLTTREASERVIPEAERRWTRDVTADMFDLWALRVKLECPVHGGSGASADSRNL